MQTQPDDLDQKIERLFGLIHEELRTLRDLVLLKFGGVAERLEDHEGRLDGHDRKFETLERRLATLEGK